MASTRRTIGPLAPATAPAGGGVVALCKAVNWKHATRLVLEGTSSDRRGGVAVMTAVSLTSLLGFAGLGTEATMWYVTKRNMQGAVDAAAFTAATALAAGQGSSGFTSAAKAVTKQYGLIDGTNNVAVTVHNPPSTGSFTATASAVEVSISQPQSMMFAGLFLTSSPSIVARAVARQSGGGGGVANWARPRNLRRSLGTAAVTRWIRRTRAKR